MSERRNTKSKLLEFQLFSVNDFVSNKMFLNFIKEGFQDWVSISMFNTAKPLD